MPRRHRLRRFLKWSGVIACLLIPLAVLAGLRFRSVAFYIGPRGVALETGTLFIIRWQGIDRPNEPLFLAELRDGGWRELIESWSEVACLPKHCPNWFALPLWIPFVLIAIPTLILWRFDRCRPTSGHCPHCSYNLTGNTSGICPECGQQIAPAL